MMAVIILFVAAMILIIAEFLLPGGVLGVIGAILLIASMTVGWMKFPEYGFLIALAEMVGTIVCIVIGFKLLAVSPARKLVVLDDQQPSDEGYVSPAENRAPIGTRAVVHTALRPAGSIMVNGDRIDAVSDGTFIDAGSMVEVVELEGARVVVEEVPNSDEPNADWENV